MRNWKKLIAILILGAIPASAVPAAVQDIAPGAASNLPRRLSWTGTAHISAGGEEIDIGLRTTVDPPFAARSETWLLSKGAASTRSMVITPDGGWIEREGRRDPIPEAMLRHERQQFGIYTLMLMAPSLASSARPTGRVFVGPTGNAPRTELIFNSEGRLVEARNSVFDPEGGTEPVPQVFRFSGTLSDGGVDWPQRIDIEQKGKPYITIRLDSFHVTRN